MDQLKWCVLQKKGIELIEPNNNLREAYIYKANEALETLVLIESKDWKITTAYYTIYYGIYSLLMKVGIKCEIHSCTIELCKRFLKGYFSREELELIDKAFQARINSQYYTNKESSDRDFGFIIENTPSFFVKCKNINLEEKEIKEIRENIAKIQNQI